MGIPVLLTVSNNHLKIAFLKKTLKNEYHLLFAATEEEAIELLQHSNIDAVLLDEKNNDIQPLVLCKTMRSISSYKAIPIMLITSILKKHYTQKALQAGISDFINEPLDKDEVNQRLAVVFSSMRLRNKVMTLAPHITKALVKSKDELSLRMRRLIKSDFFSELTKVHALATPFCLLLIEVDNYSKVLKELGKRASDALAIELTAFIREHLRSKDLLFPQGDNYFLTILPTTSSSAGRNMAEMLREEVRSQTFSTDHTTAAITISVGFVHYGHTTDERTASVSAFENLMTSALAALLLARKKGNRTILSPNQEVKNYEISV